MKENSGSHYPIAHQPLRVSDMHRISHLIARLLYRARFILLILSMLLTIGFLLLAKDIRFNFSAETIFIEDDPSYRFYIDTFLPQFSGQGTPCILAIESPKRDEDLSQAIALASERLAKNPFVIQVISPLDQPIFIPTHNGLKRFDATDKSGHITDLARDYFKENPLYSGSFISTKENAMALVFMLDLRFLDQERQNLAVNMVSSDIHEIEKINPHLSVHVAGLPFIQSRMINLLKTDQFRFVPLLAFLLVLLLMLMTKHPLGALFPILIIAMALIWTIGFMAMIGHEINMVNHAIMVLIMVIGIADAVHIYTRFVDESIKERRRNREGFTKRTIVTNTISSMLLACFLTSVTTSLGFLASSAAGVAIIKEFGMDTAIGVMFCFLATFMIMPALLSLHPIPKGHRSSWTRWWPEKFSIDRLLRYSIGKSIRYAKPFTVFALLLTIAAVFIGWGIRSNQNWIQELPDDDHAVKSLNFIERNFAGVMPFYVVFSGDKNDLTSFEGAKIITHITERLRAHSIKPTVRSFFDPLNYILQKNPEPLNLDEIDEDTYAELMRSIEQSMKGDFVDERNIFWSKDQKHLRIQGFLKTASTDEVERFHDFLMGLKEQYHIPGVKIDMTGSAIISSHALYNLTRDMISSIGLAILYISLFVALFFRSIRFTLVAIMPNILPIALTIAFMRLLDIDVRLATVMIFSMALGLSIDTCIHLLCRVKEEMRKIDDRHQRLGLIRSIYHAFHGSGRPIIYTTVILLGGFSVMMFSYFQALKDFAFIAIAVLISALLADIILLPSLLLMTSRRKR